MQKTVQAAAIASTLAFSGNAAAGSIEDRLFTMEKRINYLEQRVQSQDEVIREKDAQISELQETTGSDGGWFQNVEIGGVIEVEAGHASEDGSGDSSDIVAATVELGITAQINDWVSAEIVALYEEETDNDGDLNIDTALINIADPDAIWFVNAGQYTLPFGTYSTNMLSDPITLDMGEIGDTAIEVGFDNDEFNGSVFVFQGEEDKDEIDNFGAQIGFTTEGDDFGFAANLGYLNDINETDGVADGSGSDEVSGWIVSAELTNGPFTLIGEYITATDGLDDYMGEEPSAFNIEAGFGFEAAGMPATFAIGYQGTDDAEALDLPEERVIGAFSVEIMDGTTIGIEYSNDEAYDGTDSDTITGKLAVEF